jgi:hypothetical protein
MDPTVILSISVVGLGLVAIAAWIVTGSFLSFLIIVAVAALVFYILNTLGIFKVDVSNGGLDVQFHENSPSPNSKPVEPQISFNPIETKEVFHIDGEYVYSDAAAVCSAYKAELASFDQLMDAFSKGAEWCSYGWSVGGMALYPTQQSTWNALQQEPSETKRTACGHPGVNGGYFDAKLKFGVNCFGPKPPNRGTTFPVPLPGTDSKSFDAMVDRFKKSLNSTLLSPFNRTKWSGTLVTAATGKAVESDLTYGENVVGQAGMTAYNDVGSMGKRLYNDI